MEIERNINTDVISSYVLRCPHELIFQRSLCENIWRESGFDQVRNLNPTLLSPWVYRFSLSVFRLTACRTLWRVSGRWLGPALFPNQKLLEVDNRTSLAWAWCWSLPYYFHSNSRYQSENKDCNLWIAVFRVLRLLADTQWKSEANRKLAWKQYLNAARLLRPVWIWFLKRYSGIIRGNRVWKVREDDFKELSWWRPLWRCCY